MKIWIILSIGLGALGLVLGIVVYFLARNRIREGKQEEPNYRTYFMMGLIWFPLGLASMIVYILLDITFVPALPLFSLGLIFLYMGWANRDKWTKKN